ncbi:MAG: hypothetical protein WAX38_03510 [Minisyncoccia bacterium]
MQNIQTGTIGIVGAGGIGKALHGRLLELGYSVLFTMNIDVTTLADGTTLPTEKNLALFLELHPELRPQCIVISIPTVDTGETALQIIEAASALGITIVTCEKGALAYHAEKIIPKIKDGSLRIGYSASVGGGTHMLNYLALRNPALRHTEIQAVVNGTCNFIFHQTAFGGRTLGEACSEAVRLGYAEPGATEPLDIINGELHDIRMKTCVLFNTILADSVYITPRDLGALKLSESALEDIRRKSGQYRLVVTLSNAPSPQPFEYTGAHFMTNVDGWNIQGGFRDTQKEPELHTWLPPGVNNALHITEGKLGSGGRFLVSGPGAGHEPTTSAIMNDIKKYFGSK